MTMRLPTILAVAVGGAVGTLGRVAVFEVLEPIGSGAMAALISVNLLGALLLGWFVGKSETTGSMGVKLVAFTSAGMLASFTTFSGFALETVEAVRMGSITSALILVVVSLVGGVGLATVGRLAGSR
ncbi:MAG: fluoride efflux transporter FluC [Acidimicrobiia bacterium]